MLYKVKVVFRDSNTVLRQNRHVRDTLHLDIILFAQTDETAILYAYRWALNRLEDLFDRGASFIEEFSVATFTPALIDEKGYGVEIHNLVFRWNIESPFSLAGTMNQRKV
jgi:hypothetical protein